MGTFCPRNSQIPAHSPQMRRRCPSAAPRVDISAHLPLQLTRHPNGCLNSPLHATVPRAFAGNQEFRGQVVLVIDYRRKSSQVVESEMSTKLPPVPRCPRKCHEMCPRNSCSARLMAAPPLTCKDFRGHRVHVIGRPAWMPITSGVSRTGVPPP